jgi:mannose-1-phosphate guanylyltransferase
MLHAVIMAGGGGTRFWPRSRQRRPKQFLKLAGERTLLQQAMDRISGSVAAERTWVITGEAYRVETSQELPAVPADQIVGEPIGRDTAPCVALGASLIASQDPAAVMIVMSADHVIEPVAEFHRALSAATKMAREHPRALITFGIPPTFPATGYGYIHRGKPVAQPDGVSVYQVERFREKPTLDLAEQFLASGEYLWNSGIFMWRAAAILEELERCAPDVFTAAQRIAQAWDSPGRAEILQREYEALKRVSIDYAVMENAQEVLVVQAPFRWDDVGSWLALERMHPQDADGNTVLAAHHGLKTRHCIITGEPGHLIATIGVERLLIVQDGDVTLVADAREEGAIKQLVELLKEKGFGKYQ